MAVLFFSAVLFFFPHLAAQAAVVINEVLTGAETGGEWIELYNAGDAPENMSGWQLNPDGIGYFLFPAGFSLVPKSFVVVRLRATGTDTAKDLYHSASALKSNMGNTSGFAALFSGQPGNDTIKSYVEWGAGKQTWESAAADAGIWNRGSYGATTSAPLGFSIGLSSDGIIAGAAGAWGVFSSPTPGGANGEPQGTSAVSSASSSSLVAAPAAHSSVGIAALAPRFRAYAGQDRIVGAGSQTDFIGDAAGANGEPLGNARFLWNFGDGEVKEGRSVWHLFQIPGAYTVGLHISSGADAASDYARISVVPNKITIAAVVQGADGFVRIKNEGDDEIDIGEWILKDGRGKQFAVPTRTKIAPQSEIAFVNAVTGILKTGDAAEAALYYPNGIAAISGSVTRVPATLSVDAQSALSQHISVNNNIVGISAASASVRVVSSSASASASAPQSVGSSTSADARSDIAPPVSSRPTSGVARLFWLAAIASSFAAAGFFVIKMFL